MAFMTKNRAVGVAVLGAVALSVMGNTGCEDDSDKSTSKARDQVNRIVNTRTAPYIPKRSVEYNNYNRKTKIEDSPSTIVWCTTSFPNPSSPMITVPIAGKLTSSSVSYFPNQQVRQYDNSGTYNPELRSVDGMYHGSPPPYRYGFTPGGQYVEFTNIGTFCTTALTKFQRAKTEVSVETDAVSDRAQQQAEAILKDGTAANGTISADAKKQAQDILKSAGLESNK